MFLMQSSKKEFESNTCTMIREELKLSLRIKKVRKNQVYGI